MTGTIHGVEFEVAMTKLGKGKNEKKKELIILLLMIVIIIMKPKPVWSRPVWPQISTSALDSFFW